MEIRLDDAVVEGNGRRVVLRSMRGHDELVDTSEPGAGRALIESLLVAGSAGSLTLSEHDRILAALYATLFGEVVAFRIRCHGCGDELSLELSLHELAQLETTEADTALLETVSGPDQEGTYVLGEGRARFRLPTCDDVAELAGLLPDVAEQALERRCVLAASPGDRELLDRAMTLLSPRMEADIGVNCGSCGHEQAVAFGIEEFLCAALTRERALVLREVHVLARAYGWSRNEILDMPRRDRRVHVRLVLAESSPGGPS